jgi:hypothetical protein
MNIAAQTIHECPLHQVANPEEEPYQFSEWVVNPTISAQCLAMHSEN